MTLLPCQPSAIIDFIVQFAVRGLKEALARHPDSDAVIGQLIVLLQYESQSEASGLLWQLFQTIQKKRSFVCPSLLQYVTSIHIESSIIAAHVCNYYTILTVSILYKSPLTVCKMLAYWRRSHF